MARQVRQAIDLAISEGSGKAGSRSIEHIALDDGDSESGDWTSQKEQANAESAAADQSVIAYVGPYNSGAAGVALPVTNRAHLLEIIPAATWPGLTVSGWNPGEPEVYFPLAPRNIARLAPPDSRQAQAAAIWAKEESPATVLILDDGSSYSEGLASAFKVAARSAGLHTTGPETIDSAASNISTFVQSQNPGAIFYAPSSSGQGANAARALGEGGVTIPVFATDTALSDQFLEQAGEYAANWRVVFNGANKPSNSSGRSRFEAAFRKKYRAEPSVVAARAFDGANMVLAAIASGASTRDQVLTSFLGQSSYLGASGEIKLDQNGDITTWEVTGYTVEHSRFVQKQVFSSGR